MSLFRRRQQREPRPDAYAEAESNPELIAAELEVNQQPEITRLYNPLPGTDADPNIWVANDDED
jgi:hypothetical protein